MRKAQPAFAVPAGDTHVCISVLKKWVDGRISHVPCAAQLVREFSGWTFKAYDFQRAVEAASSPQGDAKLLLLRNMTLTPISNVYVDDLHVVYGVLKDGRDLTIESSGGPWRIKLHRGGGKLEAPRYLLLSERSSRLFFRNFAIEESIGGICKLYLRLAFLPSADEASLSTRERREDQRISSLAAYRLLGKSLRPGDELTTTSSFIWERRALLEGTRGIVSSVSDEACGQVFTVRWSSGAETISLKHTGNARLDVRRLCSSYDYGLTDPHLLLILSSNGFPRGTPSIDPVQKGAEAMPEP